MKQRNITVSEHVLISAIPEQVWDYTQDYSHRMEWDTTVVKAEVIQEEPSRVVRLKVKGGISFNFEYTQMDRPHKTSLALVEPSVKWIVGGGWSWKYEQRGSGTLWTQTNTISVPNSFVFKLLHSALVWMLRRNTRAAMKKAKSILESRSVFDSERR